MPFHTAVERVVTRRFTVGDISPETFEQIQLFRETKPSFPQLADCSEFEIQQEVEFAKTNPLPESGFRCVEARRRFLLERGTELLTREQLTASEEIIRRRAITDRNVLSKTLEIASERAGDFFGQTPFEDLSRVLGRTGTAALGLGALAVVLLVLTRGS